MFGDAATSFKALAASANDLALDRPDVAFATKDLCRHVAEPTRHAVERLKHLVRCLIGVPHVVWMFVFQPEVHELVASVDTDFAGCTHPRRCTSGGCGPSRPTPHKELVV